MFGVCLVGLESVIIKNFKSFVVCQRVVVYEYNVCVYVVVNVGQCVSFYVPMSNVVLDDCQFGGSTSHFLWDILGS